MAFWLLLTSGSKSKDGKFVIRVQGWGILSGQAKRGFMDKQTLINKRMAKARKTRLKNLKEKGKTTYLNKEWLFSRRCIDKMSLDDIAEMCNVSYEEIWEALKKLGIPIIIMVGKDKWWEWVEENRNKIHYRKI